uniref:Uncharacterized protein n=1 Tax=Salix viminalis TaxID=40686 RepID=A0A6N2MEG2_SALVM
MDVSVARFLHFTMVAISVLILRYVPQMRLPFPSSLRRLLILFHYGVQYSCQNVTKEKSGFYVDFFVL